MVETTSNCQTIPSEVCFQMASIVSNCFKRLSMVPYVSIFFEIPNPLNVFHLVCKSLELVWSMSNNFERFQTVCLRWGHSFSNALHLISWLPIVLNGLQWLPIAPKRLGSFSLAFATSNDLQKILRLPTLVQGAHDSLMLSTLPHCGRGLFADNTRLRINFERYQEVFIGFISIAKGPE